MAEQYDPLRDQSQATKDAYGVAQADEAKERARVADITARQAAYEKSIPPRRGVTTSSGDYYTEAMPSFAQVEASRNADILRKQYANYLQSQAIESSAAPKTAEPQKQETQALPTSQKRNSYDNAYVEEQIKAGNYEKPVAASPMTAAEQTLQAVRDFARRQSQIRVDPSTQSFGELMAAIGDRRAGARELTALTELAKTSHTAAATAQLEKDKQNSPLEKYYGSQTKKNDEDTARAQKRQKLIDDWTVEKDPKKKEALGKALVAMEGPRMLTPDKLEAAVAAYAKAFMDQGMDANEAMAKATGIVRLNQQQALTGGMATGGVVEGYAEGGAIPYGIGDAPMMPNATPFVNDYRRYAMMSQRMGVTPVDMEQFAYLRGAAKRAQALQPGIGAPEQGSQMGMQAFADGGMVDAMAAELETGAAAQNNPLMRRGYADGGFVLNVGGDSTGEMVANASGVMPRVNKNSPANGGLQLNAAIPTAQGSSGGATASGPSTGEQLHSAGAAGMNPAAMARASGTYQTTYADNPAQAARQMGDNNAIGQMFNDSTGKFEFANGGEINPVVRAVGEAGMAVTRATNPAYRAVQDFGGAIGRGIYNATHSDPQMNQQQGALKTREQQIRRAGYADGGAIPVAGQKVVGPGTGTSDSIPAIIDGSRPAALSTGEYVIPAEVVRAKGTEFFDKLIGKNGR